MARGRMSSTNYNRRRDLSRDRRTFSFNIAFALSPLLRNSSYKVVYRASNAARIRAADTFICSANHLHKASIYSAQEGVLFAHVYRSTHSRVYTHARFTSDFLIRRTYSGFITFAITPTSRAESRETISLYSNPPLFYVMTIQCYYILSRPTTTRVLCGQRMLGSHMH